MAINDELVAALRALGHTGSLNDMLAQYLNATGPLNDAIYAAGGFQAVQAAILGGGPGPEPDPAPVVDFIWIGSLAQNWTQPPPPPPPEPEETIEAQYFWIGPAAEPWEQPPPPEPTPEGDPPDTDYIWMGTPE